MQVNMTITRTATIIAAALVVAATPTSATAKGGGNPVACSIAPLGARCVPANCPPKSQGRPCNPTTCTLRKRVCGTRPVRLLVTLARCDARKHVLGQLIARDENRDGVVEYTYAWSGPGVGEGERSATWNGERAVPDGPIPMIAAMAEYGWRVTDSHSDANVDRMTCAWPTRLARAQRTDVPRRLRADARYGRSEHDTATAWWVAQLPPTPDAPTPTVSNSDPDADKVNPAGTTVTT